MRAAVIFARPGFAAKLKSIANAIGG